MAAASATVAAKRTLDVCPRYRDHDYDDYQAADYHETVKHGILPVSDPDNVVYRQ
jgi:hypothetical protein